LTAPKNTPQEPPIDSEEEKGATATGAEAETPAEEAPKPRDLEWMKQTLEWGIRALPGKHGLTMRAINLGIYGEIPEKSTIMNRMPRGAYPIAGSPRLDLYAVSEKAELWSDNAVDLYEEAIQRRWMGHVDVPWDTITPLPEDVELAMCQICTELIPPATSMFSAGGHCPTGATLAWRARDRSTAGFWKAVLAGPRRPCCCTY